MPTEPIQPLEGEQPLPTDLGTPEPPRPRRGELHGADQPFEWLDHRGASERVRRARR